MKTITSLQHHLVKHWVKLRTKKAYREEQRTALVCGETICRELGTQRAYRYLIAQAKAPIPFAHKAEAIIRVSFDVLKKITGQPHPEPYAAEIPLPESADLSHAQHVLVLDGVRDPGNLGTILRTALALGWDGALLTPESVDPFNDKALRAGQGANFLFPIKNAEWQEVDALLQSRFTTLAAVPQGIPVRSIAAAPPIALILGNEAHGIHPRLRERATAVRIPMRKGIDSLNVAVAGAILMYELKPHLDG